MAITDQQRQDDLIISSAVLTAISAIVVLTRSILRGAVIRKPGWDDYLIVAAMLGTIGYLIEIFILRANHVGFPMLTLTPDNIVTIIKTTLAIQVTYYAIVSFVKISILCMYLRFAFGSFLKVATYATIGFHAVFFVICIAGTLAQCQPLHKMWDFTGTVEGHCINTTAFFYFTSGLNIITDIWILALPIKTLIGVLRPTKEKIALVVIFTIGGFATIVSIIRLHSIYRYTEAEDPIRDAIAVNLWSMIEVNVGIICASVPALKPLFTPHKLKTTRKQGYQYHARDKSGYVGSPQRSGEQSNKELESFDMGSLAGRSKGGTSKASDSTEVIMPA